MSIIGRNLLEIVYKKVFKCVVCFFFFLLMINKYLEGIIYFKLWKKLKFVLCWLLFLRRCWLGCNDYYKFGMYVLIYFEKC